VSEARISDATCWREQIPLRRPYRLSRATVTALDAVLTSIAWDDGFESLGEVTPLTGYHTETAKQVHNLCRGVSETLVDLTAEEAREVATALQQCSRCATSAFLTALDNHQLGSIAKLSFAGKVPLVYAVAAHDPELPNEIESALAAGYQTLKVKVGSSLNADLQAVRLLAERLPVQVRVRFDANQAYKLPEARRFAEQVVTYLPDQAEYLEQPLSPPEWAKTALLARVVQLPIMLDESIYGFSDIRRAAECGCKFVKLKLCKQGGVPEVIEFAKYAQGLGLGVVLGNGVATDISNSLELYLHGNYPDLFYGASEANGFAKLRRNLQHTDLQIHDGYAAWLGTDTQEQPIPGASKQHVS
jgi:o-succinylbenzoate synthase